LTRFLFFLPASPYICLPASPYNSSRMKLRSNACRGSWTPFSRGMKAADGAI
jgi:hypothetical protein